MTLGSSLGEVTFFEFLKLSAEIISITNAMAITEITEITDISEITEIVLFLCKYNPNK